MSDLGRQLDDLKAGLQPYHPVCSPSIGGTTLGAAQAFGGRELICSGRACWLVETPLASVWADATPLGLDLAGQLALLDGSATDLGIRRALVLDIETGGFSGFPVFLIGVIALDAWPLRVVQFLARDYPEEEGILRALVDLCAARDAWVTFNGKSFDEPFLRDRATLHRVPLPPPRVHVDLLHLARREWRGVLPNCRLSTLEQEVLGRTRVGDIPSGDVPDLFRHFLRTGNAAPLRPVLEHNRRDLASCVELLVRLAATQ